MTTWDWRASKALGWWLLHDLRKSCSGAIDFFGVSFLFLANLQRHFQIDHSKSLQHNWVIGRSIASASLGFMYLPVWGFVRAPVVCTLFFAILLRISYYSTSNFRRYGSIKIFDHNSSQYLADLCSFAVSFYFHEAVRLLLTESCAF